MVTERFLVNSSFGDREFDVSADGTAQFEETRKVN
jgi:hypothetical protein